MASVQANGITIEYDVRGEGDPMLLVMGLGGQLVDWRDDLVDMFVAEGFQVIRFDNRDAGLSTGFDWETPSRAKMMMAMLLRRGVEAGYDVGDMADDAAGLLDALDLHSAHVVGVSMGGMIAQSLTIRHPERVKSLTSIMSHCGDRKNGRFSLDLVRKAVRLETPDQENALDAFVEGARIISGPHFDEAAARDHMSLSLDRAFRPSGTARQTAAIAASPDRTADLANVTAPTLVIHGLLDPLIQPSGGVATARAVPHSRLLNFPDMAHDLPRQRWPEIVEAIVDNTRRPTRAHV